MSGRVGRLTSKRVICSVGNNTIYSPLHELGESEHNHLLTKRAFLRCEETPLSLQGNALFILKKAFL